MDNIIEIVNDLAKNKVVESIVYKVNRNEDEDNLKDLIQDIYIMLLTKNVNKTIELYNKNQIKFFIARVIMNNIASNTSPYYTKYKKRYSERIDNLSFTEYNSLKDESKYT